ncbi:MAG TPA: TIGR03618 family F420-dependent PPOX class oxidoreductase [Capillimicrobium sp.]|nr:TIGR03618 family F420-dependent PPOX class oxidoreductase [Capillimicrobium sp.]
MDPGVRELFGEGRNFQTLATLMPDGSPHAVSVWSAVDGEHILFFTANERSQKARNVRRDPRVALSVVDLENPYRTARVRGEVVEVVTGERAGALVDAMSERYVGEPFPVREGHQVFVVEPRRASFSELPFTH